jgi:hypothetical protein
MIAQLLLMSDLDLLKNRTLHRHLTVTRLRSAVILAGLHLLVKRQPSGRKALVKSIKATGARTCGSRPLIEGGQVTLDMWIPRENGRLALVGAYKSGLHNLT